VFGTVVVVDRSYKYFVDRQQCEVNAVLHVRGITQQLLTATIRRKGVAEFLSHLP
jgi:hypothetical protein